MSKSGKIFFGIFLVLLALLVFLEANKPQDINWFESYNRNDKIPFGTYVLYNVLDENPSTNLVEIDEPPYETLTVDSLSGSYFFLNNGISFDDAELDVLLDWISEGNTLFIASNSIGYQLLDTLQLETESLLVYDNFKKQPLLDFSNHTLQKDSAYHFERLAPIRYFSSIDTANTTVLGYAEFYGEAKKIQYKHVNFIEVPFGDGRVVVNLFPQAFSNYYMLKDDNASYAAKALSYIDTTQTLYWDNHYKSGVSYNTTLLYVLFSNRYFKWAYYFVLITVFVFVLFEGKRKQRSIKVVAPLTNKTFDYTKTVAGMYLESKDHKGIIKKQIALFMEYIRNDLRLPTHTIDDQFYKQLASRLGTDVSDVKALFSFLSTKEGLSNATKKDVSEVYYRIEDMKA